MRIYAVLLAIATLLCSWFFLVSLRRHRRKRLQHARVLASKLALAENARAAQPLDAAGLKELELLVSHWLLWPPPGRPPLNVGSHLQCRLHLLLAHKAPRPAGEERLRCKICLANECDLCLVPCGHLATCVRCLSQLGEPLKCPVCVSPVTDVVQCYFT